MNSAFPTLFTDRLELREIVASDVDDLFSIHSDLELMKWYGSDAMTDRSQAEGLVGWCKKIRTLDNPGVRWGISFRGDSRLIGSCQIANWFRHSRRAALGFELGRDFQTQGIMREALTAVISWSFYNMQLNRVEAQTHPQNLPARGLLSRLGFVEEGHLRQAGYWAGQHQDLVQHSILLKEWSDQISQ